MRMKSSILRVRLLQLLFLAGIVLLYVFVLTRGQLP